MKQSWTSGVGKELSRDIVQNFKESLVLRKRMTEILRNKIDLSNKEGRSKDLYDSPNWPYQQADKRGYERALQEVIDLIS